uniref:Uncharacterized protein n=2 Tax=Oreochromis TaxID=8139 RepID=A0A669F7P4_ORENI
MVCICILCAICVKLCSDVFNASMWIASCTLFYSFIKLFNTLSIDQQDYSYITETIKSITYNFNPTLNL